MTPLRLDISGHVEAMVSLNGADFWRKRQAAELTDFPPLTAYLGDDGKVRTRAAA